MNNKGITLISLILTVIIILILTSAMIFNTKNQLQMRAVQNLSIDIEKLNSKVDEYYLKYGELPKLCKYTSDTNLELNNKNALQNKLNESAKMNKSELKKGLNIKDSNEYIVIDLEKLGSLSLNYGYDEEYKSIKNRGVTENDDLLKNNSNNEVETEIYIINTKTHQIYFPHGIFADNVMYITF